MTSETHELVDRWKTERDAPCGQGPTPEQHLGQRVRELREQWGHSQDQLARLMQRAGFKWQQTTVAKTEAGRRPVRVNEAYALADYFGVTVNDLLPYTPAGPEDFQAEQATRLSLALLAATKLRMEDAITRERVAKAEQEQVLIQLVEANDLLRESGIELRGVMAKLFPGPSEDGAPKDD